MRYTLENGVRLLVQPRREIPVVAARAALLGGQLVESEETAGLGSFLASLWMRGTEAHAAADFARRVESLAADVDGFSGRSSCGVTLDCPVESFPAVLELFAEALLTPAFADEEIERERRETLAALARREDRLGVRAFDLFTHTLFERHPYRLPIPGTPETVARFEREVLVAHQRASGPRRQPGDRRRRRRRSRRERRTRDEALRRAATAARRSRPRCRRTSRRPARSSAPWSARSARRRIS